MKKLLFVEKVSLLVSVIVSISFCATADVYMKASGFGMETQTYISKNKQVTLSQVPMMGLMKVITRLDKATEWSINDQQHIYQEKPITLPYDANTSDQIEQQDDYLTKSSLSAESESSFDKNTEYEFKKLSETRKYAGFEAVGYEMVEKGKPADTIIWIAQKTKQLMVIDKEMADFNKALIALKFANYPKQEKQEMLDSASGMQQLFMKAFANGGSLENFPKGFIMAMESRMPNESGQSQLIPFFEIQELSNKTIEQNKFDLPAGYKQVDDISQSMANQMMDNMGLKQLADSFAGMGQQASNSAEPVAGRAIPADQNQNNYNDLPRATPVYAGKALPADNLSADNPMSALLQAFSSKGQQAKPARALMADE